MFNNAGNKLVYWAKVLFFVGVAVSLALGFVIIWRGAQMGTLRIAVARNTYLYNMGLFSGSRFIITGFLVMIFGSFVSWLFALVLKAFGDLAADTKAIRDKLENEPAAMEEPEKPVEEKPEEPVRKRTRKPAAAKAEETESGKSNEN